MNKRIIVEKITEAKRKLQSGRRGHSGTCPVDYDPEGFAPCNCGASASNSKNYDAIEALNAALDELLR